MTEPRKELPSGLEGEALRHARMDPLATQDPAGLLREALGVLEVEHVTLRGPSHDVRGQDRLSGYCETCRIIDALAATGDSPDRSGLLREAVERVLAAYEHDHDFGPNEAGDQWPFVGGIKWTYYLRAALADTGDSEGLLDVERVKQAVANVAQRHHVTKDPTPPLSLLHLYGYTTTPANMDAEIAAEYARLSSKEADREGVPEGDLP